MSELAVINSPFIQNIGGTLKKVHFETGADQVLLTTAEGAASTVALELEVLRARLNEITALDALVFQGVVNADDDLPAEGYGAGWFWKIGTAGTYRGRVCEPGDTIYCTADYAQGTASDDDFAVLQANIDGAVTGPESSGADNIAAFDGGSGTIIKDSGLTTAGVSAAVDYASKSWSATVAALPEDEAGLTALTQTLHNGAIVVVDPSLA